MTNPKTTVTFRLSAKEKLRLEKLARARGLGISSVLRQYINLQYKADFKKQEKPHEPL